MKLKQAFLVLSLLVLGVIIAACGDQTPEYKLTIEKDGMGTVTSDPGGIDCGDDCTEDFDEGEVVTLTAETMNGSTFTGWGGECGGIVSCVVTMDTAKTVTATFAGGDDDGDETGGGDDDETGGGDDGDETGGGDDEETGGGDDETGGGDDGDETGGGDDDETGGGDDDDETGGGDDDTDGVEDTTVVATSTDDAEEFVGDGTGVTAGQTDPANTDLEIATDGARGGVIVGLRFEDVDVPAGATITDAYVEFTADDAADDVNTGDASFLIEVQDDVAAATFEAGDDNADISGRTYADSVTWAPADWTPGEVTVEGQYAPVTDLVETIVGTDGWVAGEGDIVFKISDDPDSDATGVRTAVSFDGNNTQTAQLVVTYTADEED